MSLIVIALVLAAILAAILIVANNPLKVKAAEKTLETDATNELNNIEKKL